MSAISAVAPRLITDSSWERIPAVLDRSMWSGRTTTAHWPAQSTG